MSNICRAKRVDTQEWVKGYYVHDQHDYIVENLNMRVRGTAELTNAYMVSSNTVNHCSGKMDNRGIEICEGDIVEEYHTIKYLVRYGGFEGAVGLGYYYGLGFYLERIGDPDHRIPLSPVRIEKGNYTVIGNFYDNKELLNVEE